MEQVERVGSVRCLAALGAVLILGLALSSPATCQKSKRVKPAVVRKELAAFFKEVDRHYPFFKVKGIEKDWKKTKIEALKRAKKCKTEADFCELVVDAAKRLRDGHLSFPKVDLGLPEPEPRYWPGVVLWPATENRVVVLSVPKSLDGVCKPGMVLTKIDGKPARAYLEARAREEWDRGGFFSSPQRARFFAYRTPLQSEKQNQKFKLEWFDGKKKRSRSVRAELPVGGWMHNYNMPEGLTQSAKSVWHGTIGDCAYVWLRRMDSSAEDGFAKALAAHSDAKAWIVDLRGNTGGGYDRSFVAKLPELAEGRRKVAVLIDAGCISAGETFARDLVEKANAKLYGQTTAGSSSTKKVVELWDGKLHVRFSIGTRRGLGKTIEFHGIAPHVDVEANPDEVLAGKNSTLERALADLR